MVGDNMRIPIFIMIILLIMSPSVMASVVTSLNFAGNGELQSSTETPGDSGRIMAISKGDIQLNQSMECHESYRHSQMDIISERGSARVKSPEYSLSMSGYDLDAAATITRNNTEGDLNIFSKDDSSVNLDHSVATKTYLNASVFVRGNGTNGSITRDIKLGNSERGGDTIASMQFKGNFNFTDDINMTGILIQLYAWQEEQNIKIGADDKL
jgi:hypothetical protein